MILGSQPGGASAAYERARPVVAGSAARDIAPDDPRGWRLGGAVAYAGLALARLGLRPAVVLGADEAAAGAAELDLLRAAGADLRIVRLRRGPIFDNRREERGVRVQWCIEPGDPLPGDSVPDAWRSIGQWVLVPVAAELGREWAAVPPAEARVALGWQGLLRQLPRGGQVRRILPGPSPLLGRAELVSVSRADLGPDVRVGELGRLLRAEATLVITDGDKGGTAWPVAGGRAHLGRRYPAIPTTGVVDPTGAGDVFLAGLVAARMGHPLAGSGRRSTDLRLAAAMGSLTVEGPGVDGVPAIGAVAERLRSSLRRR